MPQLRVNGVDLSYRLPLSTSPHTYRKNKRYFATAAMPIADNAE